MDIVEKLRNKKSRDNRGLYDAAADEIEFLRKQLAVKNSRSISDTTKEQNSNSNTDQALDFVKSDSAHQNARTSSSVPGTENTKEPDLKSLIFEHIKKYGNKIPEEYMFQGSNEEGGFRKESPIGNFLSKKRLEEHYCPSCEQDALRIAEYGDSTCSEYVVVCDCCGWECPTGKNADYGETVSDLTTWLEAFALLGAPRDRTGEDLSLLFFPDEWRDAIARETEASNI